MSDYLAQLPRSREAAQRDIAVAALETINAIASPNPERTMVDGVRRDLDGITDTARYALARIATIGDGAPSTGWQPIASASCGEADHRKMVLLWWPWWKHVAFTGWWDDYLRRWDGDYVVSNSSQDDPGPTHWQPLPSGPTGEK